MNITSKMWRFSFKFTTTRIALSTELFLSHNSTTVFHNVGLPSKSILKTGFSCYKQWFSEQQETVFVAMKTTKITLIPVNSHHQTTNFFPQNAVSLTEARHLFSFSSNEVCYSERPHQRGTSSSSRHCQIFIPRCVGPGT